MDREKRRTLRGRVISDKMSKTIIVLWEGLKRHPFYEKVMRKRKKLYVDDPGETAKVGDLVEVMETRPLSRLKRWRLVKILQTTAEE